jgi:hypothetical protein
MEFNDNKAKYVSKKPLHKHKHTPARDGESSEQLS